MTVPVQEDRLVSSFLGNKGFIDSIHMYRQIDGHEQHTLMDAETTYWFHFAVV